MKEMASINPGEGNEEMYFSMVNRGYSEKPDRECSFARVKLRKSRDSRVVRTLASHHQDQNQKRHTQGDHVSKWEEVEV